MLFMYYLCRCPSGNYRGRRRCRRCYVVTHDVVVDVFVIIGICFCYAVADVDFVVVDVVLTCKLCCVSMYVDVIVVNSGIRGCDLVVIGVTTCVDMFGVHS